MRFAAVCLILLGVVSTPVQADETLSCHSCGEPIVGAHFETKGSVYHPEHFVCSYCREPIKEPYTTYRDANYHNGCFTTHLAPRCALCKLPIQGRHILDSWGNAYHEQHQGETLSCDFCNRFATDDLLTGGTKFSDGRFLCRFCNASSVKTLSVAKEILTTVAARLRRYGLDVDETEVRLHLVGRTRMQKLANNHSFGLRGFSDYHIEKNLFGRVKRREIDIYLLYGMPRVEMTGTMAHELTHIWQFLRGRLKTDRALSEGSCNYAAYLVLKDMRNNESEFMIDNMLADEDPTYGEGFRRIKRYTESNGLSAWLELLAQKNATLP